MNEQVNERLNEVLSCGLELSSLLTLSDNGLPAHLSDVVSIMMVFYDSNSDIYFLRIEEQNICKITSVRDPAMLPVRDLIALHGVPPPPRHLGAQQSF